MTGPPLPRTGQAALGQLPHPSCRGFGGRSPPRWVRVRVRPRVHRDDRPPLLRAPWGRPGGFGGNRTPGRRHPGFDPVVVIQRPTLRMAGGVGKYWRRPGCSTDGAIVVSGFPPHLTGGVHCHGTTPTRVCPHHVARSAGIEADDTHDIIPHILDGGGGGCFL